MRMIWNKGHRIRASDKHLVYHFSIETLLFVFVAVLLLLNSKQLITRTSYRTSHHIHSDILTVRIWQTEE